MKVTLVGPDELGRVVLTDDDANDFPLVTKLEDWFYAARLFGWKGGSLDEAIEYVSDRSGEEIRAPAHVVDYFKYLRAEEAEEDSSDPDRDG